MRERPIMFNGSMIHALREERKTQTRRAIRTWGIEVAQVIHPFVNATGTTDCWTLLRYDNKEALTLDLSCKRHPIDTIRCPYGISGDHLWVREAFCRFDDGDIFYRADFGDVIPVHADDDPDDWRWQSPIHMPRWASRITLEITGVRVQQVQEISEEDAIAEGCTAEPWVQWYEGKKPLLDGMRVRQQYRGVPPPDWTEVEILDRHDPQAHTAIEDYQRLWYKINGKRHPWESNPWVWVISFSRVLDGRTWEGVPC